MTATGALAAPALAGSLRLTGGEVSEASQGIRLTGLRATLTGTGSEIRLSEFAGQLGGGAVSATGTVGLAAPMPVSVKLTARNARAPATDQLTALFDADLTLSGALLGHMDAGGSIRVQRADIRVPESLPAGIAVLDVRRPGQAPPPPATPPDIGLNLTLDAPGQVFVRGRGLDAELSGRLTLTGTAAAPVPGGGFTLRRGTFNLAGRVLTFSRGRVWLDGHLPVDPLLDFAAQSISAGVTANLAITGSAASPQIKLSSVPDLPQDQVLARLLFGKGVESLTALEVAQIAAGVAQLTGAGGDFQPLDRLREGLGLDRLSMGSTAKGGNALEAGRYLAPGVYLGAKQSLSGTGTQGTVQIDLWRGLKLEADIGNGGSTSSAVGAGNTGTGVGITWQHDY